MDHVAAVQVDEVVVSCEAPALREQLLLLHAHDTGSSFVVLYRSRSELAAVLTALQRLSVPFLRAGPGWHPAAVFEQLREEKLVAGRITTVAWRGPNDPVLGQA